MAADRTESESGLSENELAERENNENTVDDNMYRAISRFLTNREQSYEEFLNGFTHLTTEDVAKYQQSNTWRYHENNSQEIASDSEWMVDSTSGAGIRCEPLVQTACQDQNDLEEEVLEDLPHTSMMTRPSGQPNTHTLVKFDNFVEDCGGSEDDEPLLDDPDLADLLGDSSYSASFSENGSRETTLQNTGRGVPPGVCPRAATGKSEEFETETNFGEVEANSEYTVQESQTCLELTSTDDNHNPSNLKAETFSDEVERFQLDPDFDYDNIKLTPKYSADDLRIIMQTVDAEH